MNAREIRYNKMILGNKSNKHHFDEDDLDKMSEMETKEEILEFMGEIGCPNSMNRKAFRGGCNEYDSDCTKCWEQKPFEWEED